MKPFLFGSIALLLFGCAPEVHTQAQSMDAAMPKLASLPDLGPAPELMNTTWLNVDSPLRLADLTHSCCTIPRMKGYPNAQLLISADELARQLGEPGAERPRVAEGEARR